jgi:DNA processing protein
VLSVIEPNLQGWPWVAAPRADGLVDAVLDAEDLEYQTGMARWLPRHGAAEFAAVLAQLTVHNIQTVIPGDDNWPGERFESRLGETVPVILYVRGDAALLNQPRNIVGLTGARAATGYGEHVAMELAAGLVDRGYVLATGAAYGIDGMVHRTVLASRGKTIAVLAGGVDRSYPSGHESLLERIADDGAVVSEMPPGASPTKWRFMSRNRIIVALADALVVVEAGFRSGSLNTASHASAMGVPLGAVPGPITSPASAGCHRLIRESGAACITSVGEIVELTA